MLYYDLLFQRSVRELRLIGGFAGTGGGVFLGPYEGAYNVTGLASECC